MSPVEIGSRFGGLVVLDIAKGQCLCQCDCGAAPKWIRTSNLVYCGVRSCGCALREPRNRADSYVGQTFERWTVLDERYENSRKMCLCKCSCGTERWVRGYTLKNGGSRSCGCLTREAASARRGELHPNYQGGPQYKRRKAKAEAWRHTKEYYTWRDAVLARDLETCQICDYVSSSNHAHHIIKGRKQEFRFDVTNGVTLCSACHSAIHGYKREHTERGLFAEISTS